MIDAPRLLREEQHAWDALWVCFERIPDGRFEDPTLTPEGWSPKDAMYHVAGWMADCAHQLERMREGSFDATEETRDTIERQNQAWFEISRAMSPVEVRAGFTAARERMIEAFGALPEITPDAVEWFEESGALHYAKHVADLRGFLDRMAT